MGLSLVYLLIIRRICRLYRSDEIHFKSSVILGFLRNLQKKANCMLVIIVYQYFSVNNKVSSDCYCVLGTGNVSKDVTLVVGPPDISPYPITTHSTVKDIEVEISRLVLNNVRDTYRWKLTMSLVFNLKKYTHSSH